MQAHDFEGIEEDLAGIRLARNFHDYDSRDRPGESVEQAREIRDVWLGVEIRAAHERGDMTAIRNIGIAAFINLAAATEDHQRITRRAAFVQSNKLLFEHALQQG